MEIVENSAINFESRLLFFAKLWTKFRGKFRWMKEKKKEIGISWKILPFEKCSAFITARVWMQLYIHDYIRYVEKNVEYPSERIRDIDRYIDR